MMKGWGIDYYRPLDVAVLNEDGNNALHYLFMNFSAKPPISTEIAKQLIKRNIDVNFKNNNGFSALHLAISTNQQEAVKFSLEFN